jgi:hypothetical protein
VKDDPIDFLKGRKIGDAIADLEKRLQEKHGPSWGDQSRAIAGNQSPSAGQEKEYQGVADAKKNIEAAIDQVRKKKYTPLQSSIHDAGDGIRKLRISAFRGDPQRTATETKAAVANQGRVIELAKLFAAQAPDHGVKNKAEDAIRELETLIPQQENAAKAAVQNKGDPKNWEALDDATVKAESALAQIGELVNPTPGTAVLALAKKSKAEVPQLLDAVKSGNAKAADEALKNINDLNRKLADLAKDEVAKSGDAEKTRKLDENLQDLAAASANLGTAVKDALANKANQEKLANTAKALYDPLENIASIVNERDDDSKYDEEGGGVAKQEEAKKQARVILATMKNKGAKINPNHLIKASQHLAGLMSDLVGKTKVEAHSHKEKGALTERAKAALDLDELLSSMEASAKLSAAQQKRLSSVSYSSRPAAIQSLESVLASLTAIASSVPNQLTPISSSQSASSSSTSNRSSSSGKPPLSKPVTLTDSINKVARDIQTRVGTDNDAVSVVSRDLAAELQRFAKADLERRRQDMLISGRAISSHITRLITEIKAVAAQCRDPVLQDKLLKHAQTLRNFSIQLKILASVKAASADDSSNNSQLASLTQALGNVLSDVSTTLTIMKKSKKM